MISDVVGQPFTPGDLGSTAAGPTLDSIQVPLLTEAAAQTLAGWTRMDLFLDRRDTLKIALGAHQALDEAARVDSTLVASRLNTLLDAARPFRTGAVDEVRARAADLAAARPTTVAA
ncbi:hypothetical protein [Streptomyces sp. RFCAC02]|uniref:hypothetical protein n=1 Tax=Streptomyces sp. RFCAC02 TaxID=2499143 RepID=UPI001F0EB4FE|nr:hypothetical protein [Streptomyces sp. RFCAC02]